MANDAPSLSRRRVTRILGLEANARAGEMRSAAAPLLAHLERRLSTADEAEAIALHDEIGTLRRSLADCTADQPEIEETGAPARSLLRPAGLLTAVLTAVFALGSAAGYLAARVAGPGEEEPSDEPAGMASLRLESRPPGGMLRVHQSGSEDLLLMGPANGEPLELEPGRYDFEVGREDCPDRWERTIEIAAGDRRRLEATVCLGRGELVVRSNVSGDRLRIDGLDVGGTGTTIHSLRTGDHGIRVDKQGFMPFEGRVRITPAESLLVRAELQPFAGTAASGSPPGAATASEVPGAARQASAPPQPQGGAGVSAGQAPPGGSAVHKLPNRFLPQDEARGEKVLKGGSTTWHDGVRDYLLGRYDSDGSGRIDRLDEAEAIPCALWREIEGSFDQGGLGLSMSHLYGFDGSEWHPGALGFARELRSAAYEKMKECGLAP